MKQKILRFNVFFIKNVTFFLSYVMIYEISLKNNILSKSYTYTGWGKNLSHPRYSSCLQKNLEKFYIQKLHDVNTFNMDRGDIKVIYFVFLNIFYIFIIYI